MIPIFKIRCSAIGKIMTEAQGKSPAEKYAEKKEQLAKARERLASMNPETKTAKELPEKIGRYATELLNLEHGRYAPHLSETCKTYVKNWLKGILMNRRAEFVSKYTAKGNIVEDNALDFLAEHLGLGMLIKNEQEYSDEFKQGTPDAVTSEYVIDAKSSWDFTTLPLLDDEIPNEDYAWQVQGYMDLTGRKLAKVGYALMNTPEHLILAEARRESFITGAPLTEALVAKYTERMTFDDVPAKYRVKVYDVEYDEEKIERIHRRVGECRVFLSGLPFFANENQN